jgi:glycosyltransferase involved in cell wall biosynthesis
MGRIKQLGRAVLSYLPRLGLMPGPEVHRPNGLSVMMTVKDEEDWIEKSITSIADVADEVVAVDNGSEDTTPAILNTLQRRMAGKLRVFRFPREDYCAAVNFTLAQTRYNWILRWHGDFIARTTGDFAVSRLAERVRALDRRRYFCIWIGPVSLDGDLFHQIPQAKVELEPFIFVYSPALHYKQIGRFETLQAPWYYERIEWPELYCFHMRYVKPARRILYRFFWTEWMSFPDKSRFPSLDLYVRHRIQEVYNTSDLAEAARRRIRDLGKELVPYDKARFGDYPATLAADLRDPKYRLIYEGNQIVGRTDIGAETQTLQSQRSAHDLR